MPSGMFSCQCLMRPCQSPHTCRKNKHVNIRMFPSLTQKMCTDVWCDVMWCEKQKCTTYVICVENCWLCRLNWASFLYETNKTNKMEPKWNKMSRQFNSYVPNVKQKIIAMLQQSKLGLGLCVSCECSWSQDTFADMHFKNSISGEMLNGRVSLFSSCVPWCTSCHISCRAVVTLACTTELKHPWSRGLQKMSLRRERSHLISVATLPDWMGAVCVRGARGQLRRV